MAITVTSPAFAANGPIPKHYTGEGDDVSPPLAWSGIPEGAKELALICDDPDAPTATPWVHWVLYNLPPTAGGLPTMVQVKSSVQSASSASTSFFLNASLALSMMALFVADMRLLRLGDSTLYSLVEDAGHKSTSAVTQLLHT